MQQSSEYPYATYQPQAKKKDRTSAALIGAMMVFMLLGFLAGVGILLLRNSYLFS